ncbi:hypothetical protein [Actinoallomurus sp. NPDC052274]|uniref:hypothetical protein n=1 Tax=Actinoallomurus sp. NPDC052274 TaxID=3155420 RepID=UPI00342922CA
MQPPHNAIDAVLDAQDRIDVPVLVRSAPARRPTPHWHWAREPWPGPGGVPPNGWYLVTTIWREIIKHAAEVGRDVTPWLKMVPQLAGQELLARISPLQAYLSLEDAKFKPYPHNAGRRLVASIAHEHGTERSARAAFAYRLGMTMAQWACCGLMGLGATTHAETRGPNDISGFDSPYERRPDLWGRHPLDAQCWWLIEAKAARKIGLPELREGAEQLREGSKLMGDEPHRLLLCGTSLHDQVFMTIDDLAIDGGSYYDGPTLSSPSDGESDAEDHLDEDDDALLAVAEAQLLVYLNLRYGPQADLRLVPLSAARRNRPRMRTGFLTPLEADPETIGVRNELRARRLTDESDLRRNTDASAFLVGRVPGTDVRLGMSRQLFAACARLYEEHMEVASDVDLPPEPPTRYQVPEEAGYPSGIPQVPDTSAAEDDDQLVEFRYQRRAQHRELMDERRGRLRSDVRRAYRDAGESSWSNLTAGRRPQVVVDDPSVLEGATAETYIAVQANDPLLPPAADQ